MFMLFVQRAPECGQSCHQITTRMVIARQYPQDFVVFTTVGVYMQSGRYVCLFMSFGCDGPTDKDNNRILSSIS